MLRDFLARFWQRPRLHGETIASREVSFLELFYDLVFVVVIARAAHHLAEDVAWEQIWQFALIMTLVWLAWINGSLYYELHSKDDGRTRTLIFVEMGILALLAVYTAEAAGETSKGFALTYAAFLLFTSWHWVWVAKHDRPEYRPNALATVTALLVGAALMIGSVFVGEATRLALWAAYAAVLLAGASVSFLRPSAAPRRSIVSSASLTERFGLFTIIVLGEVVAGMVNGMAETDLGARTIGTGAAAIAVGFAIWWLYFDLVGRQLPVDRAGRIGAFMYLHLPISVAIAAVGAAIVSLVGHATDPHTPRATAWLLAGAFSLFLVAMAALLGTLERYRADPAARQLIVWLLIGAAVAAALIGWSAPAPWVLALALVVLSSAPWLAAAMRWSFRPDAHEAEQDGR
jgi:low temperature requirement protein LtrA